MIRLVDTTDARSRAILDRVTDTINDADEIGNVDSLEEYVALMESVAEEAARRADAARARLAYVGFDSPTEPDTCAKCGSFVPMTYAQVPVNDDDDREAWICDECGEAHVVPAKKEASR